MVYLILKTEVLTWTSTCILLTIERPIAWKLGKVTEELSVQELVRIVIITDVVDIDDPDGEDAQMISDWAKIFIGPPWILLICIKPKEQFHGQCIPKISY